MMRSAFRLLVSVFAALVLAASSVTMAAARGQTRAAGEVVICSGYGLTTITVDANGRQAGTVHICPDMVLALIAAHSNAPLVLTRPEGRASDLILVEARLTALRTLAEVRARGPPAPA